MKSYIWLQTADGSIQQVEQEVAMFCPLICQEVIQKGMGSSKNYAISLPQRVNPAMLSLILDYCRFHQVPGSSNKVQYVSELSFSFSFWLIFSLAIKIGIFILFVKHISQDPFFTVFWGFSHFHCLLLLWKVIRLGRANCLEHILV